MALGGGTFITQNKILPGSYINFVSAAKASAELSQRGIATMPLTLDWGMDSEIFTVTAQEFQTDSLKIFGYPYTHQKLKGLRELFLHIHTGYFYKLNAGGEKAKNDYAQALYTGSRGNDLRIVVENSEESTEEAPLYDVSTYLGNIQVDMQKGISTPGQLKPNDYVSFLNPENFALTAGAPLAGGTDGAVEDSAYQQYLDKIESFSFNTMGCLATDPTLQGLMINFTRRMRDENGVKFQTVLFRPQSADYEGVIGVENGLVGDRDNPAAVYWATGAEAGCAVNKSLTNAAYTGEYQIDTDYTQTELEKATRAGKLMFHQVGSEVRLLEDINTFVGVTDEKSADFGANQSVRVMDQIANDIAVLFNTKYLGKVPNDEAGRISLWNDIVKHHQELQKIRAIENFTPENVQVLPGDTKKAVVVRDWVDPISAMSHLYMTVIVE